MTEDKGNDAASARPRVSFIDNDGLSSSNEPVEHGPAIIPPFYGTSNVLFWDTATVLSWIDQEPHGGDGPHIASYRSVCDEIRRGALLDGACALYGYFPVITDNDLVIVLSPSDMMTEIASMRFPRTPENGNRSYAEYLRPEGDVIAFLATTLGDRCAQWLGKPHTAGEAGQKDRGVVAGILVAELCARVTREITRGLGLETGSGHLAGFEGPGMPGSGVLKAVIELLAAEERLGIAAADGSGVLPEHATVRVFFHHHGARGIS